MFLCFVIYYKFIIKKHQIKWNWIFFYVISLLKCIKIKIHNSFTTHCIFIFILSKMCCTTEVYWLNSSNAKIFLPWYLQVKANFYFGGLPWRSDSENVFNDSFAQMKWWNAGAVTLEMKSMPSYSETCAWVCVVEENVPLIHTGSYDLFSKQKKIIKKDKWCNKPFAHYLNLWCFKWNQSAETNRFKL